MLGKAKFLNSNVCERQNTEFQCLEKPKSKIPGFGKAKTLNSNVWKSQSIKLPMLKKKTIPTTCWKGKTLNSSV